MRAPQTSIEALRIDGFGRFAKLELSFSPGLNVLHGPNEAGKSTLMSFIVATLFGFERRSSPGRYEPPHGDFGGEVTLMTVAGPLGVRRHASRRRVEGELTLRDQHGAPLAEHRLQDALGNVGRTLFSQVFAFTLDELGSFEALAGESAVAEALFAAGMQGAQRLPDAIARLEQTLEGLFGQRARNRPLNLALQELDAVRFGLGQQSNPPAAYAALLTRQQALGADLDSLATSCAAHQALTRRLERLLSAAPHLERARQLELEGAGHEAAADFPLEAAERLQGLVEHSAEAEANLQQLEADQQRLSAQLAEVRRRVELRGSPAPLKVALERWTGVSALAGGLSARRAAKAQRAALLDQAIAELGVASLDADRLQALDAGPVVQGGLRLVRDQADAARHAQQRAEQSLEASRETTARQEAAVRAAQQELDALESVDVARARLELAALERLPAARERGQLLLDSRAALIAQLGQPTEALDPKPEPDFPRWVPVPAVVLLALGVGALWLGLGLFAGVLALVGSLAVVALGAFVVRRDSLRAQTLGAAWLARQATRREQLQRGEAAAQELDARLELERAAVLELAQTAGVEVAAEPSVRVFELQRLLAVAERRQVLERQLLSGRGELGAIEIARYEAAERLAEAGRELDRAQSSVDAVVTPLGFSPGLHPSAALELLARAAQLKERAHELSLERRAVDGDSALVEEARAALTTACSAAGLSAADASQLAVKAAASLEEGAALRSSLDHHVERLEALELPMVAARHRAAALGAEITQVLRQGGVENVEAFRSAAETTRLARSREERWRAAVLAAETAAALPYPEARLAARAVGDVAAAVADEQRALALVLTARDGATAELGAVRQRLRDLEADEQVQRLRAQEEGVVARIGTLSQRYAVAALARALLRRARERHEAETQPRVVKRATELFEALTEGRYPHLHVDAPTRALSACDGQGIRWSVEQLSRGTRELLLLAFRLAVIEDFGEARLSLPVLLDDVMVNLDPRRAGRLVEVLGSLAPRHQVLAFTCQPAIRALFQGAGARVVEVAQQTQLSLLSP